MRILPKITKWLNQPKKSQWLIFAIASVIYLNTIPNKWTIDDAVVIHKNKFVKRGISGIDSILVTDAFAGIYGKDINALSGGRYRPLTPAIFALQAELFASTKKDINQEIVKDGAGFKTKDLGKDTTFPNVLHLFNMLWYGLLCLVLYRTILLLLQTRNKNSEEKNNFIAVATALLYAVHPIHTEVVANVKSLDEILALLGSFLSLYSVFKWYQLQGDSTNKSTRIKWIIASIFFYFLALLSKETAITFIVVIPLALYFFSEASAKSIAKLTLPLILPLILFLGIRSVVIDRPADNVVAEELMNDPFLVLDADATYSPLIEGSSINKLDNPNADTFTKMPLSNQLATNVYTYGVYLKLLFVPYPLTIDYYPRHIEIKSFKDISVIVSLIIYLALLLWALFRIRQKNTIAFGILYFFITFSIVSNLFFPIGTNMAERFMFMPSVGFCLIIASLLYETGRKISKPDTSNGFVKVNAGIAVILVVFSFLTICRNFDWKDNFTLFSKDIQVSGNSGKINIDLANELILKADADKADALEEIADKSLEEKSIASIKIEADRVKLLKQAIPLLQKGLEIDPMNGSAWIRLANVYHYLGQEEMSVPNENLTYLNTAMAAYDQAENYKSVTAGESIKELKALCLMDLGKLFGQKLGNIQVAIACLEQAKDLNPDEAEIYLLLGTAYSMIRDYNKTIEYTSKSAELRPNDRDTKQNLAIAYQQYALADSSKRELLKTAEKILLEVYSEEKKLADNDLLKREAILRTLDLLLRNYMIQGDLEKQEEIKAELMKYNSKAPEDQ